MPLKVVVSDLGQVDSKYHDLYVETEGGWKLDAEIEDVSGLKSALDKERIAAREAQKQLKKFSNVDLERYEELLSREDLNEDPNLLRAKKKWDKELSKLKQELEQRDAKLRTVLLDNTVRKEALEAGVNPEDIEDVMRLTSSKFKIDGDEIFVVDDTGNVTSDTVADFFNNTYREIRPKYYVGSGKMGTGAVPNLQKGGTPSGLDAQYNEALKKGDLETAISIKNKKFLKG